MKNDQIIPIAIGFSAILVITTFILLPHLLGVNPKSSECGIEYTSNSFSLNIRYNY